ncbi:hypothetical protein [Ureibacillus manganicus]|uniref:hypothetical protein n=1 Tax=Ureibacillus manganicus TaxID=1266064 RepID=UPI000A897761|nr:hypothetical protein [Ureibacillus manganicus]
MKRFYCAHILIVTLLLAGCSNTFPYNDEDVAAIVRGEEITIGELRFLYPDDAVLDMIDGTIKAKLVVREAKKMNIDVTEEVKSIKEAFGNYPPSTHYDDEFAKSLREFVEPQAKKLGLDPEEYYKEYVEITTETAEYINAYVQEVLGEP